MKTLHILATVFASASIVCSCEKNLEEVVYSNLTDDIAFTSLENAYAATDALYAPLHPAFRDAMFRYSDVSTDTGRSGDPAETFTEDVIANADQLLTVWRSFCQIYTRANCVIDNIPAMADSYFEKSKDTDVIKYSKDDLVAQAKFMRAFAYFNLTDLFYSVPLVTSSNIPSEEKVGLSSIDDIEKVIESDLKDAASILPEAWQDRTDAQRPTFGAAKAMLVRLYMRQAGRMRQAGNAGATQKWQDALAEVNKILALEGKDYELLEDVFAPFDPTTDDALYNKELIWAVRASRVNSSTSWDIGLMFTPWSYDMGWEIIDTSLELYWKFDSEDQRLKKLIVSEFDEVYAPGKEYHKAPESVEKVGLVSQEFLAKNPGYTKCSEKRAVYSAKYKFLNTWKYNYDTPNNMPVIRFADMILCKAEILNELNGPTEEAISLINRIRQRAFGNTEHNLKLADYADRAALRSALCDERAFEFNNECLRRVDLIRMGLWKDRMDKYFASQKTKAIWRARNAGHPDDFYADDYKAYPTDLTENDVRRYYPIPVHETQLNSELKNNRVF